MADWTDLIGKFLSCDCVDLLSTLPGSCVDLVITDPPYLMSYKTNHRKDKGHRFCSEIANDNNQELIEQVVPELYRVMKDNTALYMFCNNNKVDVFKQIIEQHFTIKNIIVWVKNNHTAGDLVAQYGKKYEFIVYANKGRCPINGTRLTDIWFFDRVVGKNQVHQNEKPLDLIKQIIEKSAPPPIFT